MALEAPDKLLIGSIDFGTTIPNETYSSLDTYDGVYMSFICNFTIIPQQGAYPDSNLNLNLYNANDITIGMKFALPTSKMYDVIGVTGITDTEAIIELRDTNLREYINSNYDPPNNFPDENQNGIFYEVIDGAAKLGNLQQNEGAFTNLGYWIDDIIGNTITELADFQAASSLFQQTGSFYATTNDLQITGSLNVEEGTISGDGSGLYNIPASGVTGLELFKITSGSVSASLEGGDLRINTNVFIDGTITATEYNVTIVSSSVLYSSGSTKFGDTDDDTHQFTGSVFIHSGSLNINSGDLIIDGVAFSAMTSGTSGTSGSSGSSGTSGTSGTSGSSGSSGTSGTSGTSGSSGISGVDGTSGTSGSAGTSGTSGSSGSSGTSGTSGTSGSSGSSGTSGS
jgi:hypothetical protein